MSGLVASEAVRDVLFIQLPMSSFIPLYKLLILVQIVKDVMTS